MTDIESPEAFAERLLRGIGDLGYIDCFEPGRSAQALADAADTIRADRTAVRREVLEQMRTMDFARVVGERFWHHLHASTTDGFAMGVLRGMGGGYGYFHSAICDALAESEEP